MIGDPINSINLIPHESKKLLVHSRDNCIRLVDYATERCRVRRAIC